MPDVFTKRKRSEVMSRIRGRGNKETELALARLLRAHRIAGWRRQEVFRLPATERRARRSRPTNVRPDFVFPKQRVAVFVDGCFWHGCPIHSSPAKWLRKSSMPLGRFSRKVAKAQEGCAPWRSWRLGGSSGLRTGKAFWRRKLAANRARDRFVNRELRRQGWRVVRIWEHELGRGRSQRSALSRQRVLARIRQALR